MSPEWQSAPRSQVADIMSALHEALRDVPSSLEALGQRELRGESANGAVRAFCNPFGELRRVEIDPDHLRTTSASRLSAALLAACDEATRAAAVAKSEHLRGISFLGIPIGAVLDGSPLRDVLPPLQDSQ